MPDVTVAYRDGGRTGTWVGRRWAFATRNDRDRLANPHFHRPTQSRSASIFTSFELRMTRSIRTCPSWPNAPELRSARSSVPARRLLSRVGDRREMLALIRVVEANEQSPTTCSRSCRSAPTIRSRGSLLPSAQPSSADTPATGSCPVCSRPTGCSYVRSCLPGECRYRSLWRRSAHPPRPKRRLGRRRNYRALLPRDARPAARRRQLRRPSVPSPTTSTS